MRKTVILSAMLAAGFALSGCSQEAQDKTEAAADAAGDDVEAAAAVASEEAAKAADDAGAAIDDAAADAGAAVDKVGDKIEDKRAAVEADAQDETKAEAKVD